MPFASLLRWNTMALGTGVMLATLSVASEGRADQFVLFDETFTFTKEDADNSRPSRSHYYLYSDDLNPERPTDWTSPVDYRNGTVHIRIEVIDKPLGSEVTQWSLCYIPNRGQGNGYGCTGTGTYTEEGVYDRDESMTSWWENQSIVWSQGIKEMHLVMKDSDGASGFAHLREDAEQFFPTTLRLTMVQVAAGSEYDPSQVPNLPPPGGSGGMGGAGGSAGAATAGSSSEHGGSGGGDASPAAGGSGGPLPTEPSGGVGGTGTADAGSGGTGVPADPNAGQNAPPPASQPSAAAGCRLASVPDRASNAVDWLAMTLAGLGLGLARRRARRATPRR